MSSLQIVLWYYGKNMPTNLGNVWIAHRVSVFQFQFPFIASVEQEAVHEFLVIVGENRDICQVVGGLWLAMCTFNKRESLSTVKDTMWVRKASNSIRQRVSCHIHLTPSCGYLSSTHC